MTRPLMWRTCPENVGAGAGADGVGVDAVDDDTVDDGVGGEGCDDVADGDAPAPGALAIGVPDMVRPARPGSPRHAR